MVWGEAITPCKAANRKRVGKKPQQKRKKQVHSTLSREEGKKGRNASSRDQWEKGKLPRRKIKSPGVDRNGEKFLEGEAEGESV